jgi:hypothetical protein
MLISRSRYSAVPQPRSLYIVPERRVARADYVPAGRSLHLVDLENLMGGPWQAPAVLQQASDLYREVAPVQPSDHVIVATNTALAVDAGLMWPGAELRHGTGVDGADLALIRQVQDHAWIAARYDRVVIGSGDGIFASVASAFRQRGVAVGVIAREGGVSPHLVRHSDFLRLLPEPTSMLVVA